MCRLRVHPVPATPSRNGQSSPPPPRRPLSPAGHRNRFKSGGKRMRTVKPTVFLVQTVTMAVLLSLVVSPLAAKEYPLSNGSSLLSACKKDVARTEGVTLSNFDKARGLMCAAYIKGFVEGHDTMAILLAKRQYGGKAANSKTKTFRLFCYPETVAVQQLTRVVIRYLEQHPETLHLHPVLTVTQALREAFPCQLRLRG